MAAEEKDSKLATALRQAKTAPMRFAFVAVGSSDGVLMVAKKKIAAKDVNGAKAESGGSKVYRGRCVGEDGVLVFEVPKEPPTTLAKQLKAVIQASAGMMMQVAVRVAADLEDEGEEGEGEGVPDAPPFPTDAGAPPAPPVQPAPDAAAAKFAARLKALGPVVQKLDDVKSPQAADVKLAISEAGALFRAKDYVNANEALDGVEDLIKKAFAASPSAPPGNDMPPAQDAAARFATRLKAIAPLVPKAELTGSAFAGQAKAQIGEANKLYVARQYNEANLALDKAEALIKQAFAGTSAPNQGYTAALAGYQTSRLQAVGRLRELAKEVGAEAHADAAKAQIELKAVVANLTETPATAQQVDSLQKYLLTDDVVFDVCDLAYDFRTPLLKQLDAMKATFAS